MSDRPPAAPGGAPSAAEIVAHHDPAEGRAEWLVPPLPSEQITVADPDPTWPARAGRLIAQIEAALGPSRALALQHVGSTSVPDLPAKDVIDLDLTVADPSDEPAYLPALESLGYILVVREPGWHEHRCLRLLEPRVNLHVFGPGCPEPIRHRLFRDWLRDHPEERVRYAEAKRAAVPGGGSTMDFNARKEPVIQEIYARAFRAAGLI